MDLEQELHVAVQPGAIRGREVPVGSPHLLVSDQQVIDFLVARYGDFVLLKPLFTSHTLLLWLSPLLVLLAGVIGLMRLRGRRSVPAAPAAPLTAEEKRRISELVD